MKKFTAFLLIFVSVFSCFADIAFDFTQKNVLKGKFPLKLRGNAVLKSDGLHIQSNDQNSSDGAVINGRQHDLTPENAFEMNIEAVVDGKIPKTSHWMMFYDSKYVAMPRNDAQKRFHKGFMFFLVPGQNKFFRMGASFGFGDKSVQIYSKNFTLSTDTTHKFTLLFTATGKAIFSLDGKTISTHNVPAGTIAIPDGQTVIGNRIGRNYFPFTGIIKKTELKKAKFTPQDFTAVPEKRRVFERGEKKPLFYAELQNFIPQDLDNITISASTNGKFFPPLKLKNVKGKSKTALTFPLDPYLLPGTYKINLKAADAKNKIIAENSLEYTIAPTYGDFMPVILWGNYEDFQAIRQAGFTHQMVHLFPRSGNFDRKSLGKWIQHLDDNLKVNLYTFGNLHAHFRFINANRHLRTGRDGKVYPRKNLEASHPAVQKEFAEAARTTVEAVGSHPAFDGVLINSEVRDGSLPSFKSGIEPAAFKKFSGYDIPSTISGKSPRPYIGDPAFPWDRVISENHKDLTFLRWFWFTGDGWNPLQTILADTIRNAMRNNPHKERFFTFYDPVTRVPPMWGSGGDVDMISQWTYTYPDPIKIGQATDEVIAMSHGNPKQKIASMTQAIWYRSQTAPLNKKVKNPPAWLNYEPQAQFISIAPDSLREALWSKISRRLDAIMYHGVGSILARTDHKLYRLTNNESLKVLKNVCENIIVPLGPVLKKVPERQTQIAILENLASSFYAPKHFPMGWSKGWAADLHLALQWGHFQPAVIYDEHLLNNKNIDNLKVLFVPGLEVVTFPVLAELNKLRNKGVIIIGDEFTTPALMIDYRIKSVTRNSLDPASTKKELQKLGAELALLLDKYSVRPVTASNQDLIVRQRGNDKADYVFIVNDKRTFGDYVGQWGLVQEKGLKNSGTITVNHPASGAYDLVKHQQIPFTAKNGKTIFNADLPAGDGMLVLLLNRKIKGITLDIPAKLQCGKPFEMQIKVLDEKNNPVPAIIPVEISITDNNGQIIPPSDFYAAVNGKLTVKDVVPTNLEGNKLTVKVRCLASGIITQKTVLIKK